MTGDSTLYIYSDNEAPSKKINYSYSKFGGEQFLSDYRKCRDQALQVKTNAESFSILESKHQTSKTFINWIAKGADSKAMDLFIKRFEVTKKVYSSYTEEWRPPEKTVSYDILECYILASYALITEYKRKAKLQYVNALLKLNDIVLSNWDKLSANEQTSFAVCIESELSIIHNLRISLK